MQGIAQESKLLVAADEFQCLNNDISPNVTINWLKEHAQHRLLETIHRINDSGLLEVASAIRNKNLIHPLLTSKNKYFLKGQFKLFIAPTNLAPWIIAKELSGKQREKIVVLTPSFKSKFVKNTMDKFHEPKKIGTKAPIYTCKIYREESESDNLTRINNELNFADHASEISIKDLIEIFEPLKHEPAIKATIAWVNKKTRITGKTFFTPKSILQQIERCNSQVRRYNQPIHKQQRTFMSIHQAKNREFDGVIILWPYTAPSIENARRRLLYNAITRARNWCILIVESEKILNSLPFNKVA